MLSNRTADRSRHILPDGLAKIDRHLAHACRDVHCWNCDPRRNKMNGGPIHQGVLAVKYDLGASTDANKARDTVDIDLLNAVRLDDRRRDVDGISISHFGFSPTLELFLEGECYRSKSVIGNKTICHRSLTAICVAFFNGFVIYKQRGCKCSAPTYRSKILKVVSPVSASVAECARRDRASHARRIPFQDECVCRWDRADERGRAEHASDKRAGVRSCSLTSSSSSSLVSTFSNSLSVLRRGARGRSTTDQMTGRAHCGPWRLPSANRFSVCVVLRERGCSCVQYSEARALCRPKSRDAFVPGGTKLSLRQNSPLFAKSCGRSTRPHASLQLQEKMSAPASVGLRVSSKRQRSYSLRSSLRCSNEIDGLTPRAGLDLGAEDVPVIGPNSARSRCANLSRGEVAR